MQSQNGRESRVANQHRGCMEKRQPSDVLRQAAEALKRKGRVSLVRVEIELVDGAVLLRGKVPSYYIKQLAQESILPVAKEFRLSVSNLLQVNPVGRADGLMAWRDFRES